MAFSDLIEQLGPTPQARGRQFERLCRWYLENAPEYCHRLRSVWLWNEWPGRWGPDVGIDLVAETVDGDLWAIQAKALDLDHSISKPEVDSFLSESSRAEFTFRLLIATTDGISANAYRTLVGQEKAVGLIQLSHLETVDLEWPSTLEALAPSKRSPLERRDHQREAIQDVLAGFERNERGQLIMACGTGKTLVALWVAEDLNSERTLILVPSLTLLSQTLREWTANASKPFDYLAVCSDETVTQHDAMVSWTADLGLPVTTDPVEIESFLRRDGRLVIFATYQSSPRIADACTCGAPPLDLVIADEAHRCTGPVESEFATVLDDSRIGSRWRLFMTATPRYFSGRIRKIAREADYEIASMDDEEKFGPIFHRLTFGEAIERDLLSDYSVLVIGVDEDTYRRYIERGEFVTPGGHRVTDARTLASHIGLAKAVRRYDLKRVISFHGRIEKAQTFSSCFPAVVDWMPADDRPDGGLWSRYVSGEMPTGQRDALLWRFRHLEAGTRGLLSNARCLAEGVDVPAIDGVTFIDPRRSTIDIIQAVGRAIRRSPDKSLGVVVLPVFVGDDEDPQKALDDSSFKPVWDVLKALRAHDEVLAEELDALRRRLGREKVVTLARPDKISLDLPAKVGEDFARAFDVRLVLQSTASWESRLGLLERFVEREGHALVPKRYVEDGFQLGQWATVQRRLYAQGELSHERQCRLEQVPGWIWDPLAEQWERGIALLNQFAEREGHSQVSHRHREEEFNLGWWVMTQRTAHEKGKLGPERVSRLQEVPRWTWSVHETSWEEGIASLKQFVGRAGHALVPKRHLEGGFRLGRWVVRQRAASVEGKLDAQRQRRLEEMRGWTWDTREASWEEHFALLKQFVDREGHARVPKARVKGNKLGSWVANQRTDYKKGELDPERQRRLEEMRGWTWDAREASWEEHFALLKQFVDRKGHARVPLARVKGGKLGMWAAHQQQAHRKGKLDPQRVRRLEALPGWTWGRVVGRWKWEEGFAALKRFVGREGHAIVPRGHVEERLPLGRWVSRQRQAHRDRKLEPERQRRLEALPGWVWDARGAAERRDPA